MAQEKLSNACSQYGASMGRRNTWDADPSQPVKFRLYRLEMVNGDYDNGGAYWGYVRNQPMWRAIGQDSDGHTAELFIRCSHDRNEAKAQVRANYPEARFYR